MAEISIVLPTYNGEAYIEKSINSILAQTFHNWELIIVDDHSEDRTGQVADRFARTDKRIRVIHNSENRKLPGSLNIGFSAASGSYLTWTSDDNCYLPEALERMYDRLRQDKKCMMVCADMDLIDKNSAVIKPAKYYDATAFWMENSVGACFLYRRSVLDHIGLYDETLFCVEDYDYWMRIRIQYGEIGYIHEVLYRYRIHPNSLSESKRELVQRQLAKMRCKHFDAIVKHCGKNPSALCQIYYQLMEAGIARMRKEYARLVGLVPELRYDRVTPGKSYIIFGAGNYGERMAAELKERAVCFVDNDVHKIGQKKCGLKIISFDELVLSQPSCPIMLAVDKCHLYEMIHQLYEAHIYDYCTFQNYSFNSEKDENQFI